MKFESKHAYKAQGEGLVINDGESRHEGHEGFAELGDELDFEYQLACPSNTACQYERKIKITASMD